MSLCPACGLREADDYDLGFCTVCAEKRAVDRYLAKDADDIVERQKAWAKRSASSSPHAARERQRRHRLREAVKPRETADEWSDPLELGKHALDNLQRVRNALGAQVTARAYLDEACELVRVLAWGPIEVDIEDTEVVSVRDGKKARRQIVIMRPRKIPVLEGQEQLA